LSPGHAATHEIAPEPSTYLNWPVVQQVPVRHDFPEPQSLFCVQAAQVPFTQPWSGVHATQASRLVPQVAGVVVPVT